MRFIKGKVIITFLSGCVALFFAWEAARQASVKISKNVNKLSEPIERLHLVNRLFRDINRLEQLQRAQTLRGAEKDTNLLLKESALLRRSLDTLQGMYKGNSSQVARIESMKKLLEERDSLYSNYMKVREGLVNSKELSEQLTTLTSIYSESPILIEKIITTEKTSTVTLNADEEEEQPEKKPSKGFLGRLFGKKKAEEPIGKNDSSILPHEELESETVDVKIDTLTSVPVNPDSIKREIDKARRTIVSTQKLKSTSFVNREAALMNAGNIMINQMLNVLQQVENDAVRQVEKNSLETKDVVAAGANRIISIIFLFVLATAILLYLILSDISKSAKYRKQLEEAKDEAERHSAVRQRFLANMSHEIRTPLQSIIGYSEQLRQQKNPRKEDIEAIHYSSEHLLQIVNEILDYSRLASGKFSLSFTSFSIKDLLSEIMTVMQPQAQKKSIDLNLYYDSQIDWVKGDPFRLKQVLYNLLSNAVKFTDTGWVSLWVDVTESKKMYYFSFKVEDTGTGIPEDRLEDIFNQFEQINTSAVASTQGTGLGLSIVKEIVELQGGKISVHSEVNKGSIFTVELGFAIPPGALVEQTVKSKENFFEGLKVYLVDDDHLILQLCCTILEKHQIDHVCFTSPSKLLNSIEHSGKAVVFADIRMPEMSGIELCTQLRKQNSALKIFALTAEALPEERQIILESGFDGLLMKPFKEADILGLLKGAEPDIMPQEVNGKSQLDLSNIEVMTFGDTERLITVLHQYVNDTEEDMKHLASLKGTEEEVPFLLHRLSGRSAQLGASRLAELMREIEILLHNEDQACTVTKEDLSWIVGELQLVVEAVKEEITLRSGTSPSCSKAFSDQY